MPYLKIAYNTFYFYIYTCRLSVFRFFDQILLADRVLESLSVTESVFFGRIYFGRAKQRIMMIKNTGCSMKSYVTLSREYMFIYGLFSMMLAAWTRLIFLFLTILYLGHVTHLMKRTFL